MRDDGARGLIAIGGAPLDMELCSYYAAGDDNGDDVHDQ